MIYTVYILDDEPLAIKVIEQYLTKFTQFKIVGVNTDSLKAQGEIAQLKPDLLFLDLEMPSLRGFELLAILHKKPSVIITTAYREFAVEGFEFNVLDYLVKPIPLNRFIKAIQKFLYLQHNSSVQSKEQEEQFIFVRADRQFIKVEFDHLLYVEGLKDYVKIKMDDQNQIVTKMSIGHFLALLPKNRFLQIHKSYVVNPARIESYTSRMVKICDFTLPISEKYKSLVLNELSKNTK